MSVIKYMGGGRRWPENIDNKNAATSKLQHPDCSSKPDECEALGIVSLEPATNYAM